MNNNKIIFEDNQSDFSFKKEKSNLNIVFNRVAFIFFIFFIIFLIFVIHSIHLGSRNINSETNNFSKLTTNNLYRADILDLNGNYLSKTENSIDIGISPSKIINEKKLIINLKYIFPNKDYIEIKKKIKKVNFLFRKKFQTKIMKNWCSLAISQ